MEPALQAGGFRKVWCIVVSCDYNGWNDAPEDEREWFDSHPEIWAGRASDTRPLRVTDVARFASGMFPPERRAA
jgi:hypothetical protein